MKTNNPSGKTKIPVYKPMLASPSKPFNDRDYIFEVKWDGYRCLAYLDDKTTLYSRNLKNITSWYPELNKLHKTIKKTPAVVDGEIIVLDNGKPSFAKLQARTGFFGGSKTYGGGKKEPAILVAFDILYLGDEDISRKPLELRKNILEDNLPESDNLLKSRYIEEEGITFYEACIQNGLEGVVAKKLGSPYVSGRRSNYWFKFKKTRTGDFIICGYTGGKGARGPLGALILGLYRDSELVYVGQVGTGLTRVGHDNFLNMLTSIESGQKPFKEKGLIIANAKWVKPKLVCTVEYLEVTNDSKLRHPSFIALRHDKQPQACTVKNELFSDGYVEGEFK